MQELLPNLKVQIMTPKEELSLSRSVNYKNTGFKPEISPYEVGRLLTKCIDSGNTVQELTDFFQFVLQ